MNPSMLPPSNEKIQRVISLSSSSKEPASGYNRPSGNAQWGDYEDAKEVRLAHDADDEAGEWQDVTKKSE